MQEQVVRGCLEEVIDGEELPPFSVLGFTRKELSSSLGAFTNELIEREKHSLARNLSSARGKIVQRSYNFLKPYRRVKEAIKGGLVSENLINKKAISLLSREIKIVEASVDKRDKSKDRGKRAINFIYQLKQNLAENDYLDYPRTPKEVEHLCRLLASGKKITVYAPGCPDYSHNQRRYTFRSLGKDVPLIALNQIKACKSLMDVSSRFGVNLGLVFSLADCEAEPYFVERYTGGDREEFLNRCYSSKEAIGKLLDEEFGTQTVSTTFLSQFPEFFDREEEVKTRMRNEYQKGESFQRRIDRDIRRRRSLYRAIYFGKGKEFLVERTIRTLAQYEVLADLVAEKIPDSLVILHSTVNARIFRGKGIPVFQMQGELGEVY